jgi:hypothetical protein
LWQKDLQKSDRVSKIRGMTETETANALRNLANEILALAERLAPQADVAIPKSARDKIAAGRCLQGDEKPAAGRRGLCDKHYQQTMRRVRAGKISEAELIAEGLLLPESPGGRKTSDSPVDNLIKKKAKPANVARAAEVIRREKAAKK